LAITITTFEFGFADQLDVDIKLPKRTAGHQLFRENHETSCPEGKFYKITGFISLMENMIHQIETRFSFSSYNSLKFQHLIPAFLKLGSFVTLQENLGMYSRDVDFSSSVLKAEYDRCMFQ